jgi:repressor LexA
MPRYEFSKPTPRQLEYLDFIAAWIETHNGKGPSVREIMKAFGLASPRGIQDLLDALERKGLITREALAYKTIRLVDTTNDNKETEDHGT